MSASAKKKKIEFEKHDENQFINYNFSDWLLVEYSSITSDKDPVNPIYFFNLGLALLLNLIIKFLIKTKQTLQHVDYFRCWPFGYRWRYFSFSLQQSSERFSLVGKMGIKTYRKIKRREFFNTARAFYQGGFDPTMNRREAQLILGVREGATPDIIRNAHRKIMVMNHPDAGIFIENLLKSNPFRWFNLYCYQG